MEILKVQNLCKTYGKGEAKVDALKNVSFSLEKGEFAAVVGESGSGNHHYNDSRYHMLNLHATFTKGTVEFRLFQFDEPTAERRGGIHAGQLKSYIQLCLALSQMAKDVRTASPKPQQNENPKYAMRTWLLRLGFIGEEFATARDFLTRNLSGDTAFRHGRAAA